MTKSGVEMKGYRRNEQRNVRDGRDAEREEEEMEQASKKIK